jgi:hypothetical protein
MPERGKRVPEIKDSEATRAGTQTWKQLSEIQKFGYSSDVIFRDFVDICLNSLLSLTHNLQYPDFQERLQENRFTGPYEDNYMAYVARYRENKDRPIGQRPADFFAQAWATLQLETAACEQDVLGEMFMREISRGDHGQYFSPTPICDMMAQMTGAAEGETACDPACGSGRMLLSLAKINPRIHVTGVDVSETCAKMAVLNMWLFNMNADIYLGNSLSMEMTTLWRVRRGGYVFEADPNTLPLEAREQMRQAMVEQAPTSVEETLEPAELVPALVEEAHRYILTTATSSLEASVVAPEPPTSGEPTQNTLFDLGEFTQKKPRRIRGK